MLDIHTEEGWKFGGAWKKKLCPGHQTTILEPTTSGLMTYSTVTTTTVATFSTTTVPDVCEPSLIQVEILISILKSHMLTILTKL